MKIADVIACDYTDPAHARAIAALINAYIADEMGGGAPLPAEEQDRLTRGLRDHPRSVVLLARAGEVYAGLLVAFENFSTFTARPMLNIHDVIVLPSYRGKGIGRQLMTAILAEARERSCSRVTLEVRKDNAAARHLYASLGFKEPEESMFYWRKYLP
jgi:ribosomal protein S18 acetylase RimI-like enzyme